MHRVLTAAASALVVVLAATWVTATSVAGAPAADTGSTVDFTNDARSVSPNVIKTVCQFQTQCDQRVQVNFDAVEPRDQWRPPVDVFSFQTVNLGRVETFQVSESYAIRPDGLHNSAFFFFYFVQIPTGTSTVRLMISQLHSGQLPAGVRSSERCRQWTDTTGSLDAPCPR